MRVEQDDLVIIADTGRVFVVKNHRTSAATIEAAPPAIADNALRIARRARDDAPVRVLQLPQDTLGGGCSCFLINLRGYVDEIYGMRSEEQVDVGGGASGPARAAAEPASEPDGSSSSSRRVKLGRSPHPSRKGLSGPR